MWKKWIWRIMSRRHERSLNPSKKHYFPTFQKYQLEIINPHCHFNFKYPQITPSLILNLPSNIVQFVCGGNQSLFLDSKGNLYSVGDNGNGSLGLGHNTNQNELNKIENIPPIEIRSSKQDHFIFWHFLLDCEVRLPKWWNNLNLFF